jgi:hypothetical protein
MSKTTKDACLDAMQRIIPRMQRHVAITPPKAPAASVSPPPRFTEAANTIAMTHPAAANENIKILIEVRMLMSERSVPEQDLARTASRVAFADGSGANDDLEDIIGI